MTQLQQHYSYANSPVTILGIVYTIFLEKLKILLYFILFFEYKILSSMPTTF